MRNLATIQKIKEIKPIEGADAIEVATVLGWHVVVKKGEFKQGDLCVYFEIDSLLPQLPEFEFLSARGTKKSLKDGKEYEGYRLQTIRLRGQISQGLCQPLSILEGKRYKNNHRDKAEYEFTEGEDVTELLGVIKYEPPIPAQLSGKIKGMFPSFIPKTDETRIQSVPDILERYKDELFYATEKLDGSSVTIYMKDGEINVCSRNINMLEDDKNSFWSAVKNNQGILNFLDENPVCALQGELVGEGIQGNRLKLRGHQIYFFNMYDYELGKYLNQPHFLTMCNIYGLDYVPVLDPEYKLPQTVDEVIAYATRKSEITPDVWVEGVVFRPREEMTDPDLGRLSFKAINPEFLLKYGE